MRTHVFQKVVIIMGVVLLSTASAFAQKVNFSIQDAVESLKRDNQCRYCPTVYQFTTQVSKITNIAERLKDLSGKKKLKKFRRFQKCIDDFLINGTAQHRGLAKELAHTKSKELGNTMKDLIKLQTYVETISQLFDRTPSLLKNTGLQTAKIHLDMLYEAVECTLELNTPSK